MEIKIEREAHADLGALTQTLLHTAFGEIAAIKNDPFRGDELGDHPDVGDLTGCRKIYFNNKRHRVVYQLVPDESNPRTAKIIAVGRRANLRVYHDAAHRLGRTPGRDAPHA